MPQERHRSVRALRIVGVALALAGLLAMSAIGRGTTLAQEMATPESDMALGVPMVSVSGHGSVNVPPDTASATIGVEVIKPTLGEAQEQSTVQATAVNEALEDTGITSEDIRTAQFNVSILRDNSQNADPTVITGFKITD